MQEDTVLNLAPFGIDSDIAIGHCCEGIGLSARRIQIPSHKHITLRCHRHIIIGPTFVKGRKIGAIRIVFSSIKDTSIDLFLRVAIAIYVCTVSIYYFIHLTIIIEFDRHSTRSLVVNFTIRKGRV